MNKLDKLISYLSPEWAFNRTRYRAVQAAYEAAKPDRTRTGKMDNSSGDRLNQKAGNGLHGFSRHLEQNNDFCYSILVAKTNNVIGAKGITVEPMPLRKDGTIHTEFKKILLAGWQQWCELPDVTRSGSYADCERLAYWAKQRDGECFIQLLVGEMTTLRHNWKIPLSIELIERDYLPLWNSNTDRLQQSIERNDWGQAVNYQVLKQHPEGISYKNSMEYRVIPAERMLHLKRVTRFKQSRGVPLFAQIIKSLEWIGSYLRSEAIAALTASMFAVVIKKGSAENYESETTAAQRQMKLDSGIILDDLLPGESLDIVSSNRPNSASTPFIDLVTKFMASAVGVSYSNVTNNYISSYTAARAERCDAYQNYKADANEFINEMTKPIYKKHIEMGVLAGVYQLPKDLDLESLFNASYSSPEMVELDPNRDANASANYIRNGLKSTAQVIREKGGNPDKLLEEESNWKARANDKGLWFDTFIEKPTEKL